MKKLSFLLISLLFISFVSCGPGAKQREAEQARLDSIAALEEQWLLDSVVEAEALKAAEEAAQQIQPAPVAPPPAAPQGVTRQRSTDDASTDPADITRMRRAPEETAKEEIDSTTTRRRRSD